MSEQVRRFQIDNQPLTFIRCGNAAFNLEKVNTQKVTCRDCGNSIPSGLGFYRYQYRHNGYICVGCLESELKVLTARLLPGKTDSGFRFNWLGTLESCYLSNPDYPTQEVIDILKAGIPSPVSIDQPAGAEILVESRA